MRLLLGRVSLGFFRLTSMENGIAISLMSMQSYDVGSRLGVCGLVAHPSALWQRMVGVFFSSTGEGGPDLCKRP